MTATAAERLTNGDYAPPVVDTLEAAIKAAKPPRPLDAARPSA